MNSLGWVMCLWLPHSLYYAYLDYASCHWELHKFQRSHQRNFPHPVGPGYWLHSPGTGYTSRHHRSANKLSGCWLLSNLLSNSQIPGHFRLPPPSDVLPYVWMAKWPLGRIQGVKFIRYILCAGESTIGKSFTQIILVVPGSCHQSVWIRHLYLRVTAIISIGLCIAFCEPVKVIFAVSECAESFTAASL